MAIRNIIKMGDPRLLAACAPVQNVRSQEIQQLIRDMWETMAAAGGIGLAAPQVAVNLQIMVFGSAQSSGSGRPQVPPTVLINPKLAPVGTQIESDWEGCLSIPGLRGKVPRWHAVHFSGLNALGEPIAHTVEGFHARVVQHEYDHLQGVLYPMQMKDLSQFGFNEELLAQQQQA
ncbi:peptide deformylase [Lampropedia aestuarii]|uniref:peptide deformylase n=1 Tax=Lampropedia aestuarii TaxID=2562762 RepID=UPI002469C00F|nr:peptide deformylase [Lampropedia aestuarii]MDH5856085.1 peptide deformylase [Lampropedia aestuarii]